jgi:hypothetical protein
MKNKYFLWKYLSGTRETEKKSEGVRKTCIKTWFD